MTLALQRLRTLRRILIDPAMDEHGGRIVNTGGNSLLIRQRRWRSALCREGATAGARP
jgi:hypothetical protein